MFVEMWLEYGWRVAKPLDVEDYKLLRKADFEPALFNESDYWVNKGWRPDPSQMHESEVCQAILDGESVSAEVLADYPDLAPPDGAIEPGDWITDSDGLAHGIVISEGTLARGRWPAWKIREASGEITVIMKDDAQLVRKDAEGTVDGT